MKATFSICKTFGRPFLTLLPESEEDKEALESHVSRFGEDNLRGFGRSHIEGKLLHAEFWLAERDSVQPPEKAKHMIRNCDSSVFTGEFVDRSKIWSE